MFTVDDVEKRAVKCRELLKFQPYKDIVAEMEELIEDKKEQIVKYLVEGRTDMAMIDATTIEGIRRFINQPIEAVEEANNLNDDSE